MRKKDWRCICISGSEVAIDVYQCMKHYMQKSKEVHVQYKTLFLDIEHRKMIQYFTIAKMLAHRL